MSRPTIEDLRIVAGISEHHPCKHERKASRSDLLAALGLVIECEECGGDGEFAWCRLCKETHRSVPPYIGCTEGRKSCPSCDASGYRVAPELVELVYQSHPAAGRENAEQLLRQVLELEAI